MLSAALDYGARRWLCSSRPPFRPRMGEWLAAAAPIARSFAVALSKGSWPSLTGECHPFLIAFSVLCVGCSCFAAGCACGWLLRGACRRPGLLVRGLLVAFSIPAVRRGKPEGYRFHE